MPVDQKLIDTATNLEQSGKTPAEILDLIKSSQSYSDVGTKIEGLRTSGMQDEEIYGHLKTAKVSQPTPPQEPQPQTIGDRVASVGDWMENKRKEWTTPVNPDAQAPEWAGKYPNVYAAVGALREAGKPVAEGLALGSNITPVGLLTGGLKYAAVEQAVSALDKVLGNKGPTTLGQQAGQAVKDTGEGALMQAAGGLATPVAQGFKKGLGIASESTAKTVTGAAAQEIGSTIKDLSATVKGTERIDQAIKDTTKHGFEKGIKPSIKNLGSTDTTKKAYFSKVSDYVQDVIENKADLEIIDKKGNPVKSNLPQSVADQLTATEIGRQRVYKQSIAMLESAEGKGAAIDVKPMVSKLEEKLAVMGESSVVDSPAKNKIIKTIRQLKSLPEGKLNLSQAANDLAGLNTKLAPGWNKVGYKEVGEQQVDAFMATQLRNELDNAITSQEGEGFRALKSKLGAYKTVESDIAKRANQIAGTPQKGIFDLSDIWIGYHSGLALFTGNVPALAAASGAELIKKRMQTLNSPDHAIKSMFKKTEKLMDMKKRITDPQSVMGQSVQKGMGASDRASMKSGSEPKNIDLEGLEPSAAAKEQGRLTDYSEKKSNEALDKKYEDLKPKRSVTHTFNPPKEVKQELKQSLNEMNKTDEFLQEYSKAPSSRKRELLKSLSPPERERLLEAIQ